MRIIVEASPGDLAANPDEAIEALAQIASADGAGADWLVKAARTLGATRVGVSVPARPAFRAVNDQADAAVAAYERTMKLMVLAIEERLRRAAAEVDTTPFEVVSADVKE